MLSASIRTRSSRTRSIGLTSSSRASRCRRSFSSSPALSNSFEEMMGLRFGLYAEMQTPRSKPHAELYHELLRQIEHADEVGFDVYSIIEHHFFQEFSI